MRNIFIQYTKQHSLNILQIELEKVKRKGFTLILDHDFLHTMLTRVFSLGGDCTRDSFQIDIFRIVRSLISISLYKASSTGFTLISSQKTKKRLFSRIKANIKYINFFFSSESVIIMNANSVK